MDRSAPWSRILVLEDDAATSSRRYLAALGGGIRRTVRVRLHELAGDAPRVVGDETYKSGNHRRGRTGGRADVALTLLQAAEASRKGTVIVAGTAYGSNRAFLQALRDLEIPFVVEVRPSDLHSTRKHARATRIVDELHGLRWHRMELSSPVSGRMAAFMAAKLDGLTPHKGMPGELFVAQTGAIGGIHRGTIFGFASGNSHDMTALVRTAGWARWIRPLVRRRLRKHEPQNAQPPPRVSASATLDITVRSNITLSERHDQRAQVAESAPELRGTLGGSTRRLNVLELFAGAGGMGLGFLLAGDKDAGYRLSFSAEVNPIYVSTLRRNHQALNRLRRIPGLVPHSVESTDLRSSKSRQRVLDTAKDGGKVDVLIGGPPCQGFSNANRNSWSSGNPNNRLVDVYIKYVEQLRPPVFLMENVQGILWTPKHGGSGHSASVVDHLARRLKRAGYLVFPKLLDAVWYGVPQHRSRFFLVGISLDLGYDSDDFGTWGPFPRPTHGPTSATPYVTVHEAIRDLPALKNGEGDDESSYPAQSQTQATPFLRFVRNGAPKAFITDHVTSQHASYVIERYKRIPPGGNWEDIAESMSNYANVERTHSNIYRRLEWQRPSITIGHYRKSMLIHPNQHRGLSLREASRLQSFPDWFRFSGTPDGSRGGLVHKQQQLANAVCPLVSKALADFIIRL